MPGSEQQFGTSQQGTHPSLPAPGNPPSPGPAAPALPTPAQPLQAVLAALDEGWVEELAQVRVRALTAERQLALRDQECTAVRVRGWVVAGVGCSRGGL